MFFPEGPSSQYVRTLVPKTIPLMVFGIRVLICWVPGLSGFGGGLIVYGLKPFKDPSGRRPLGGHIFPESCRLRLTRNKPYIPDSSPLQPKANLENACKTNTDLAKTGALVTTGAGLPCPPDVGIRLPLS